MGLSLPHILLLSVVAVFLLGGGRFSALMGDVAKGMKQFKNGMAEDDGIVEHPILPSLADQFHPKSEPNADRGLQPMRNDRPHD